MVGEALGRAAHPPQRPRREPRGPVRDVGSDGHLYCRTYMCHLTVTSEAPTTVISISQMGKWRPGQGSCLPRSHH